MSDWRQKQGAARFRGVPFYIESSERSGGRQTVAHEIPFSEDASFTEDIGLKGRGFTVDGYVVGTEYEAARDALLKALETEGPGELVHPYFGTRRVAVVTFRVGQKRDAGGMATFSIDFRESSTKPANPTTTIDAGAVLTTKVAATRTAASTQYVAVHSKETRGPDSGLNIPRSELTALQSSIDLMSTILDSTAINPHLRAAFDALLESAPSEVFDLQSEYVVAIMSRAFESFATAVNSVTGPIDRSALFLKLYAFNPGPPPPATTPNRVIERANFDGAVNLVRRFAITHAAESTQTQTFISYDDAIRAREAVTDVIDEHVEAVTDETFAAFVDLRGAVVEAVPGADTDLPRIQSYTPPAVLPSLVLAHRLYGNLDREEDLILRNGLRHPGFVPAEQELEILSDG